MEISVSTFLNYFEFSAGTRENPFKYLYILYYINDLITLDIRSSSVFMSKYFIHFDKGRASANFYLLLVGFGIFGNIWWGFSRRSPVAYRHCL